MGVYPRPGAKKSQQTENVRQIELATGNGKWLNGKWGKIGKWASHLTLLTCCCGKL